MPKILNSDNFGQKLYDRFPPKYREDDEAQDLALKRYLQALSEGGFKHSIDEIKGITSIIDPNTIDSKALHILFKQYGLDIFNGIPENYLRYLLPRLGEAWSKKGSMSVVEFITSSLSGIKTSTEIAYDDDENPLVNVKLEMDYNIGDYFPEAEQFTRLLENFVPFYCDVTLIYSYLFYDSQVLGTKDDEVLDNLYINDSDNASFLKENSYAINSEDSLLGNALLGLSTLGGTEYKEVVEYIRDNVKETSTDSISIFSSVSNSVTNRLYNTLNDNFITNGVSSYDVVRVNGEITDVIY